MTNLPSIASYYKAIKVSHSYSIHRSAGLKILVSAVRFRLRAPSSSILSLKHTDFYKVVIYFHSTLVAHFYDCIDRLTVFRRKKTVRFTVTVICNNKWLKLTSLLS